MIDVLFKENLTFDDVHRALLQDVCRFTAGASYVPDPNASIADLVKCNETAAMVNDIIEGLTLVYEKPSLDAILAVVNEFVPKVP